MKNLILVGFRGVGKSTIGREIAEKLKYKFLDLDEVITEKLEEPIVDFAEKNGVEEFRKIETESLETFLNSGEEDVVLVCGGGIVETPKACKLLERQSGIVAHLFCEFEIAADRLAADQDNPRIGGVSLSREELKELWVDRAHKYEKIADYNVNAAQSVDEIVAELAEIKELSLK